MTSLLRSTFTTLRTAATRPTTTTPFLNRPASSSTTASPTPTPPPTVAEPTPDAETVDLTSKSHYLLTLLRSPLHLPSPLLATCKSLGLTHRLSSSIIPITPSNTGYILRIKELVGVRAVSVEEVSRGLGEEWRERDGDGRRGNGLSVRGGGGVIRVGSERCRGEERGFKVVR